MTTKSLSLLWGAIIIAAALLATSLGMDDGASFGVIAGLSGAAYASIAGKSGRSCGRTCL